MTNNRKIILIEDNRDDYEALIRGFKACNCAYSVEWFNDSSRALQYLMDGSTVLPALIVLDLNLPGMDGRTLLKLLKSHSKMSHIPIIVVSTSADQKDIEYCYSHGANSYIQKPVNFSKMKEICQSINNYWFDICLLTESSN